MLSPYLKKKFCNRCEFSVEKFGSELTMKDQHFLHSKICNDNKKMYKFKKKNIKLKKYICTHNFNKKTSLYARLKTGKLLATTN